MRKLIKAAASRVSLLTYLAGTGLISFGAALIYVPAGVITIGVALVALVLDMGAS